MADVIGMSDVSSPDTGKGSQLKTGGKRSHNMAKNKRTVSKVRKCKTGQVWDQKLKKCKPVGKRYKEAREAAEQKQSSRRLYTKGMKKRMLEAGPGVGTDEVWLDNF